jgi:hypothetical protein
MNDAAPLFRRRVTFSARSAINVSRRQKADSKECGLHRQRSQYAQEQSDNHVREPLSEGSRLAREARSA